MDGSRLDARTVALALLCLAVVAFAAATLDTATESGTGFGAGNLGQGDQRGGDRTPVEDATGDGSEDFSILDINGTAGTGALICVPALSTPVVQAGLVLAFLGIFAVGWWYDDAAMGLGLVVIFGYPTLFAYLLLTACGTGLQPRSFSLSPEGQPSQSGGGLVGGQSAVQTPSLLTQLLLVLVLGLLGVVAVLVLTGDHDQTDADAGEKPDDALPADDVSVAAIGAAAGRAADRLEREGAFENEVYRAWAEMTEPLSVDDPASSTPGEFAAAAVDAGMDREDVERLTRLFADVRYGGAAPTAEREAAAVETLRRIEDAYADGSEDA